MRVALVNSTEDTRRTNVDSSLSGAYDAVDGWSLKADLSANLDQQPRAFEWTNTISF